MKLVAIFNLCNLWKILKMYLPGEHRQWLCHSPANTICLSDVGAMLTYRLRRWPSTVPILGKHIVFAVSVPQKETKQYHENFYVIWLPTCIFSISMSKVKNLLLYILWKTNRVLENNLNVYYIHSSSQVSARKYIADVAHYIILWRYPANTKHLYNIYTTLDQHCINVIQMSYHCCTHI